MFPSFATYDDFLAGLGECLSTEFFGETYPLYDKECEEMEDVDVQYIRHFLTNGLNPQDGLAKILDCFFHNTRYAQEGNLIQACIQPFLDAGATLFPLTSKIIVIPSDESNLEEESTSIEVRSRILDYFWRHMDLDYIQSITDWTSIKAKYWEYISESEEPFMAFCRYYKCCSDYLRGEHTRFANQENEQAKRELARTDYMEKMMADEYQDDM